MGAIDREDQLALSDQAHLIYALTLLQERVHNCAQNKGWWRDARSIPECLALIHSEVSEALEAYRECKGALADLRTPTHGDDAKPEGVPVELADLIIRVLDLAQHLEIDLARVLLEKHAFNRGRPYRHGNKTC
jgi:NTP pyrophosphatase (non-canonical NTP hydrolase)